MTVWKSLALLKRIAPKREYKLKSLRGSCDWLEAKQRKSWASVSFLSCPSGPICEFSHNQHYLLLSIPVSLFLFKHSLSCNQFLFFGCDPLCGRSHWPRGLGHEQSLPAWTLGSWVRIPLEAWMPVYAFILCVGNGLATGWSLIQRVQPTVYRLRNWKAAQVHKGCRAIER
jgi:hypothetical protein